jgi:large subunit ribosomal protein L21
MYAIVEIAGKQFRVTENQRVMVPRLRADEGQKIELDKVLLVSTDDGIQIGQPLVEGAKVEASVLKHDREKKIIVFKKKRRKNYRRKKGHRQPYTELKIEKIVV